MDTSTPHKDLRVEEVRILLLLEQGLWIQVIVLYCSRAKAARTRGVLRSVMSTCINDVYVIVSSD